jgi:hypothetical protein
MGYNTYLFYHPQLDAVVAVEITKLITRVGTQSSLGPLFGMRACYSAKLVVSFH